MGETTTLALIALLVDIRYNGACGKGDGHGTLEV